MYKFIGFRIKFVERIYGFNVGGEFVIFWYY